MENAKLQKESFTSAVKAELTGMRIKRSADAVALLCAFTLGIGSLKLIPEKRSWGIHYVLKSKPALELVAKLIDQHFSLDCRLSEVRHERLNAQYCELLVTGVVMEEFMLATGFVTLDEAGEKQFIPAVPTSAIKTETQKKLFIRGLFLACGMVSQPGKSYHAEFVIANEALAAAAQRILLEHGIEPKTTKRKGSTVLYVKEGERLENLLAYMGASSAMMEVSNERIVKQAKNEANRSVNCISANLERVTRASQRQAEDIKFVLDTLGAENLPDGLRVVAEERMNNYELSLSELAEELGLGKSAVNYRLKKLSELAQQLRDGGNGTRNGRR